ncbi:hypothetical protein A2526_01375 [candidate division WOR-1 bacterium RIFOXYD2_FULL_36_8]|uniref:DNA polymerase III subunit delta n=1 Tax=candidate division WOR-1 bacterium RIFOXYB2_FULL_36_35 TaxID=1802578 RepID=A0A1F4S9I9_UNCSA|nr:MAG: hypothetical protein A2230_05845 [candidate division WOR-1 bacterium RIFOXYA2_FULL_36_21]OGC16039.1 MAG: hypothetical protein A2282_05295 [candidate division WOR-1 bacterium RIFOXYA12_FULL_36_13]OGC16403.1 MAG: hypothetical protein A2290_02120 [candidate division WOR-1 bacterium RIFOXYB2_FULL_36_35]OGC39625.1 MAG: hypothetical protein A2526_01375 [candidate division WOR-1 bacterium RIFOXYD2_FULL_36_8]
MESRTQKILSGIIKNGKVSNAYLFTGGDNQTKFDMAINFASQLNCSNQIKPCNLCLHCEKIKKNKHPDVIIIEKDGNSIKIEQIRNIKNLTKYGPSEGNWQVIIITEADKITTEAANSFLKILEEPAKNVVFILISNREGILPKTILSRCQRIIFEDTLPADPTPQAKEIASRIESENFNFIEISELLADKKTAAEILQEIFSIYVTAHKVKQAKIILETLKGMERNANHKLAIDALCIKLWNKN